MKTLLVDDNQIARLILNRFLSPFAQCDEAVTGEEGIEMFKQALASDKPYDLVVLDVIMPNKDGLEALHEMRQAERKTEVSAKPAAIMLATALTDPWKHLPAMSKDLSVATLTKPIFRNELMGKLKTMGLLNN